jgi:hypothetical protein
MLSCRLAVKAASPRRLRTKRPAKQHHDSLLSRWHGARGRPHPGASAAARRRHPYQPRWWDRQHVGTRASEPRPSCRDVGRRA